MLFHFLLDPYPGKCSGSLRIQIRIHNTDLIYTVHHNISQTRTHTDTLTHTTDHVYTIYIIQYMEKRGTSALYVAVPWIQPDPEFAQILNQAFHTVTLSSLRKKVNHIFLHSIMYDFFKRET